MAATVLYEGSDPVVTLPGFYDDITFQFELKLTSNPGGLQYLLTGRSAGPTNEVSVIAGNGPFVSIQQQFGSWSSTGGGLALNTTYICEARYQVGTRMDIRIYPYGSETLAGAWWLNITNGSDVGSVLNDDHRAFRVGTGDWLDRPDLGGDPLGVEVAGDTTAMVNVATGTLTATATGGTAPYTYAWSVVSGPVGAFSAATAAATTFTPNAVGTSVLRCTVTDDNSHTSTDNHSITVTATNLPPTVNVGPDKGIIDGGNAALLSAVTDSDGTVTGVVWTVQSGPSTSAAQFSTTTETASTFTPAGGVGTYVIRCTATDDDAATGYDELNLTVSEPATSNIQLLTAGGWVSLQPLVIV